MDHSEYKFSFEVYDSAQQLTKADADLLQHAKQATQHAYAPYSNFKVGAVARMANGELVTGTNQENASFPVGICAERVLLSTASSLHPSIPIETIAISCYTDHGGQAHHPIAPCGVCRQSLHEYEQRFKQPIRLILGGMDGKVFIIPKASLLLPLAFSGDELPR